MFFFFFLLNITQTSCPLHPESKITVLLFRAHSSQWRATQAGKPYSFTRVFTSTHTHTINNVYTWCTARVRTHTHTHKIHQSRNALNGLKNATVACSTSFFHQRGTRGRVIFSKLFSCTIYVWTIRRVSRNGCSAAESNSCRNGCFFFGGRELRKK